MKIRVTLAGVALSVAFATVAIGQDAGWDPLGGFKNPGKRRVNSPEYAETVRRVAEMVGDPEASRLVIGQGLNLLNVTWEDTGRFKNSSVGPNISDMTIQVALEQPGRRMEVKCMPVIRYDNFSDKTADLDPDGFTLLVGNEKGRQLKRISLSDFLENPTYYLSKPSSWKGNDRSLWAPRDSKVLVSAQAAFLPVPKQGKATFNPVLFNYQSVSGDPAVLTILATREGTSTTIIDNKRDAFREGSAWGQRLFFNQNGQRTSLTGERLSDFKAKPGNNTRPSEDAGLNMVLLIQVPLKQRYPARFKSEAPAAQGGFGGGGAAYDMAKAKRSDVEVAVIGHGDMEGPFTEIDNLQIERDDRFPVRVTVQFYKATSNGVVTAEDVSAIKHDIDRVYSYGSSVGSLVTGGETGRITEYEGMKIQPAGWWSDFWRRHQANTGDSPDAAIRKLRKLLGHDYQVRPVCRLYLSDLLRK